MMTSTELRDAIRERREAEEWYMENFPGDDVGNRTAETQAEVQKDPAVTTDEDDDEESELQQDLYEALDLLTQLSDKLTRCLKVDRARKTLTPTERQEIQEVLGETQLFTEQWEWEEDK